MGLRAMTDLIRSSAANKDPGQRGPESSFCDVLPPTIDLRRESNIRPWFMAQAVLQNIGAEFKMRLQVMMGAASILAVCMAVAILVLIFSSSSKRDILIGW